MQRTEPITPNKLLAQGVKMAARKWTDAQKAKQSAAIRTWQPWQHSTGAKSAAGKAIVSRNAYRCGMRPFLRLISLFARECRNFDTMTEEKMEALEKRCFELCNGFHVIGD